MPDNNNNTLSYSHATLADQGCWSYCFVARFIPVPERDSIIKIAFALIFLFSTLIKIPLPKELWKNPRSILYSTTIIWLLKDKHIYYWYQNMIAYLDMLLSD